MTWLLWSRYMLLAVLLGVAALLAWSVATARD